MVRNTILSEILYNLHTLENSSHGDNLIVDNVTTLLVIQCSLVLILVNVKLLHIHMIVGLLNFNFQFANGGDYDFMAEISLAKS